MVKPRTLLSSTYAGVHVVEHAATTIEDTIYDGIAVLQGVIKAMQRVKRGVSKPVNARRAAELCKLIDREQQRLAGLMPKLRQAGTQARLTTRTARLAMSHLDAVVAKARASEQRFNLGPTIFHEGLAGGLDDSLCVFIAGSAEAAPWARGSAGKE